MNVELFSIYSTFKNYDLDSRLRGHSMSLEMPPFLKADVIS